MEVRRDGSSAEMSGGGVNFGAPGLRLGLVLGVSLAAVVALLLLPRIPLEADYHDFADKRSLAGIPNCLDVVSNVPFMLVGLAGFFWLLRSPHQAVLTSLAERISYLVFFAGVALTGAGSFWYHLAPGNSRLPWDLLPMACCFMSLVTAQVSERMSARAGGWLLCPALALGIASVLYWRYSEIHQHGDYRFYLFVQFFPALLLGIIIILFPTRYSGTWWLFAAFLLYVVAKLFELLDRRIWNAGNLVSGHSLKHVTAALSCYLILRMLQQRRPATGTEKSPAFVHRESVARLSEPL